MPIPQQLGRGDRTGRGPYEKSGIVRDSSLPPHKTVSEKFEINFPFEDVKEGDKTVRKFLAHEMTIDVELWYMPYGTKEADGFLWNKFSKKVSISKTGK
ncbi:MAG: hypothetical protein HY755_02325 [Nitrospirae bacterium]|nr:hypothetical protein [Nitrospirota bacterium]